MRIPVAVETNFLAQQEQDYDYDKSSKYGIAIKLAGYYTAEELETKIELLRDAKFSLDRDNAKLEK